MDKQNSNIRCKKCTCIYVKNWNYQYSILIHTIYVYLIKYNAVHVYLCLLWTKHFPTISAVVLAFGEWEPNGAGMALLYTIVLYPVIRDHSTWLICYGPVVHSTFVLANKHRTVIPEHIKGRKPQLIVLLYSR